ncbi:MAG: chromate resistance protein [Methylococcaceae bacterium]|nr:chromate resistance protein [Methylococcaceae bacterium]
MIPSWLILIVSLPTQNSAGRMRVWRVVKALGCAVLRDGVYLMPNRKEFRQTFKKQAEDILSGGGSSHVLVLEAENPEQQQAFESLFDRSADYTKLIESIHQASRSDFLSVDVDKLRKQLQRFRKDLEAIAMQDFFPGAAREQAAFALEDLEHNINEHLMPDEPQAVNRRIKLLRLADYQGRIWATRQRPWIDRLASAWLIQRFIDPDANFIWLIDPGECPADALGFDFDGAEFTHVGAKVTFEVLLASFGLGKDNGLNQIANLVHYLDVGGIPVPEAAGLETLVRGMKQRWSSDDDLLIETNKIFDSYYQAFSGNNA